MRASKLAGRNDGDTVWLCFPSAEINADGAANVKAWIHEATVFNAQYSLVQLGGATQPRAVHYWCETVHDTPQEAWLEAAKFVRRAATELLAKAAEFEATAAKIAARKEVA